MNVIWFSVSHLHTNLVIIIIVFSLTVQHPLIYFKLIIPHNTFFPEKEIGLEMTKNEGETNPLKHQDKQKESSESGEHV